MKDNELYRYVNVNLEGRDTVMADAPQTNVQGTQVTEDTHVIIPAPVNPKGQQQNVPVTTIVEPPLLSATTLPPPPAPLITRLQQTPQFLRFPALLMRILLTRCMKQSKQLFNYSQTDLERKLIINTLDDNIKKIIKEQVKEQVKAQTSHSVATNLSELELKKILIDKMESNKSIHQSDEQKNLYKALVDAYESDKLILDTYGDIVSFKRHRDDEDKDEESSAGCQPGVHRGSIPFNHFINNDLAYLSGGVSSQTYTTSATKTKAADYGHIKWIEDLVPNTMWSQVLVSYDKYAPSWWNLTIGVKRQTNSMDLQLTGNLLEMSTPQNHCCHKASNSRMA
ncbi:hypothetical protein Tco_0006207 [Tanacetum coccineum]